MTNLKNSKTSAEAFYLDPMLVSVKEGLPRFRKDLGKIEDLAESLQTKGQLQPIVVNRENELIAGGRRLAACLLGGFEVLAIYHDAVDPIIMRELEVEENVQRKAFTPAEEVLATEELHRIKQSIYGASQSGKEGGWSLEKTADAIGKSKGTVIEDLKLAEALKNFPELGKCKTKSDIKKAVSAIETTINHARAASAFDKVVEVSKLPVVFEKADALEHMVAQPDKSVDLLLTDPPYGMDVFDKAGGYVGKNLGVGGTKYDDSKDASLLLYKKLAVESYRFCSSGAHAYVFCCPEHFPTLQGYFAEAGWNVHIRPIIWIKRTSGQNNNPTYWPSSCYEMILYARKLDSRLVVAGLSDWIQCDPILGDAKVHQAQKPIPLLRNLISRSVYPNSNIYDPFAGSASTLIAGLEEKCNVLGCELGKEAFDAGRSQIINYEVERQQRP